MQKIFSMVFLTGIWNLRFLKYSIDWLNVWFGLGVSPPIIIFHVIKCLFLICARSHWALIVERSFILFQRYIGPSQPGFEHPTFCMRFTLKKNENIHVSLMVFFLQAAPVETCWRPVLTTRNVHKILNAPSEAVMAASVYVEGIRSQISTTLSVYPVSMFLSFTCLGVLFWFVLLWSVFVDVWFVRFMYICTIQCSSFKPISRKKLHTGTIVFTF